MRKEEIVKRIADKTGIERAEVEVTVNALFAVVKQNLVRGHDVHFRGFGSFIVKRRAAKKARNITKNETLILPERFIPIFRASEAFIEHVKSNSELIDLNQ